MSVTEPPLYFDTSALLPYYREEALSDRVQSLLQSATGRVYIGNLVEVEVASALARWVRTGEFTESDATMLQRAFEQDLAAGCFERISLSHRHLRRARDWLLTRRTALRTLDALHLASALDCHAELVTADRQLADVAEILGIRHCRLV